MSLIQRDPVSKMGCLVVLVVIGLLWFGIWYHGYSQGRGERQQIRATCVDGVNDLLKAQGYTFKFRTSEMGIAMTFPSPSPLAVKRAWENNERMKEVKR